MAQIGPQLCCKGRFWVGGGEDKRFSGERLQPVQGRRCKKKRDSRNGIAFSLNQQFVVAQQLTIACEQCRRIPGDPTGPTGRTTALELA